MEDCGFEEIMRSCGLDEDELNYFDDSGHGFVSQDLNHGSRYYQVGNDNYSNVAVPPVATAATRRLAATDPQHFGQGHLIEDDIAEFDASDPYRYDVSSPSPSYPRSHTADPSHMLRGQSLYVSGQQNRMDDRNCGAYMHVVDPQRVVDNAPLASQSSLRGRNPRNAHNLRLRPVSELPDMYRAVFKFGVFNAIQSKCYETIMHTKENMVVSAPTGGGKTVLFELGLIEMLMASGHHSSFKCVYVAPTKALCSERTRDWTEKFEPLGVKCCEMTGDTMEMGKNAWTAARNARVIITTSEKWDSLTRNWHDRGDFLSEIKLFLVDEVHILNESRGSTLEVVISRMKSHGPGIRFLLVSATVPNIRDIADWVGNPSMHPGASATVYEFGDEYRPCKITRHVHGYPSKNQNDFQFARTLDFKVYPVLQQYACGKPVLIFCSTRKGVLSTGEQLLKEYEQTMSNRQNPPWSPPRYMNRIFHDKRLEKLAKAGIGVHHAGLSLDDRRVIEDLFLDGSLRVLAATSTLAVGVNLPAHTVIIKGVKLYQNNAWQEYSDLDIVQMIGRAGRPQFDKEGIAIILCEANLEHKYRNLAHGTIIESSLHKNLCEHINSEIGIGTIRSIQTAKEWLRDSFLRRRMQKNPGHYHIGKSAVQTWEEKLDDMVLQSIRMLKTSELIATEGDEEIAELSVTEYGDIMNKYYIRQSTMGSIMKLSERPSVREILEVISCAEELGDIRLRGGDKQVYNKIRDHPDIRYRIKKVEKASDKAFILIQAVLGGISLSAPEYKTSDSQPALDALSAFRHTARIARVVVEVAIVKKNGAQLKHGLELVRCLTAKAWEDRPVVLKQIESIGEKSLKVLAEHGVTSLQTLRRQDPTRIELLLNRRSPFGHEVLAFVRDMPQYDITITVDDITSYSGKKPVSIELTIECRLLEAIAGKAKFKQRLRSLGMTSILTTTSDLDFIDFRRISTKALKNCRSFSVTAELSKPSQSICVLISSEIFAGLTVTQSYKPSISAKEYPTMDTHPKTSHEMLLEDLEDDPNFWSKMMDDDSETEEKAINPSAPKLSSKKSQCSGSTSAVLGALGAMQANSHHEPKKLPNGNYSCNHTCKDKSKCRHLCCREGTAKPASTPRKQVDGLKKGGQDQSTPGVASAKRSTESQKKPGPKPGAREDNRLEKLESLHKLAGVNDSLRLPDGRRIKLDDNLSSRKPNQRITVNFDMDFADLRDEDDREQESAEDMPDTKQLLASTERKSNSNQSSENERSDSKPDAIINETPQKRNLPTLGDDSGSRKRKVLHDNNSPPAGSAAKKSKIDTYSRMQSDDNPLFLRDSSMSSSSVPAHSFDNADTELPDDYFVLDETLFDIAPPHKTGRTAFSNSDIVDNSVAGSYGNERLNADVVVQDDEEVDVGQNDWADFQDWLENSGSVRIVDSIT